jgi:phosphocarrier protein HPr
MERHTVVEIAEGLHARTAARFARLAADQGIALRISRAGSEPVDAASVLGVMTLGADAGTAVVLHAAEDADPATATAALDVLEEFLTDPGR